MSLTLAFGSAYLITYNYQNETTYIDPVKDNLIEWRHPFFMGAVISLGQSLCLLVYLAKKYFIYKKKKASQSQGMEG
jgi:hypothetical protein